MNDASPEHLIENAGARISVVDPERRDLLSVGIGRTLLTSGLLTAAFTEALAKFPEVNLRLRAVVGIVYVSPVDLTKPSQTRLEENDTLIEERINGLVNLLCDLPQPWRNEERLHSVHAKRAANLPFMGFTSQLRRRESDTLKISIWLRDQVSSFYPDGHKIEGERNVLKRFLNLQLRHSHYPIPQYRLRLGSMHGPSEQTTRALQAAGEILTPSELEFSAIGPLRLVSSSV